MRQTLLALSLVLLCLGNAAHANSSFDGHIVFCAPPNPPTSVEVLPDGTEILTFVNIGNIWFTGNPLIDGFEENHVTATFQPNGEGTLDISGTVDVDAVDGGWRFRQILFLTFEGEFGFGIGVGTGDLRGRIILYRPGAPEEIENSPCAVDVGATIRGRIVTLRWRT